MAEQFALSEYNEIVPGIVSSVASFSVCLTYLLFPDLRQLRYIELVFFVAFNNLLASIGISFGNTDNGSAACWYQGISTNVNYLSAIMWSTVITYQVWRVVCQKNVIKDLTYAHIVCWGIPILVSILPLTTSTYSNPDDEAHWCFIANRSGSPKWSLLFWFIVAFYGWLWLAMLFNAFMIGNIAYRFYQMQQVPDRVKATARKLLLYPIIITVCWSLSTFVDLYTIFNPDPTSELWYIIDGISGVMAIMQGLLFAVVFFAYNTIVRNAWMDMFRQLGCIRGNNTTNNQSNSSNKDASAEKDDCKSVSMVSVSVSGASSISGISASASARPSAPRRSSGGGFLGRNTMASANNSWYVRSDSIHAAVQDEFDFIPQDDTGPRLSQRLSILDFLRDNRDGQNLMSTAMTNLSTDRSPPSGRQRKQIDLDLDLEPNQHNTQSNPMLSMAVNDFGSVMSDNLTASQSGTGTATLSVRRAADGVGYDSDEESGSVLSGITGDTRLSTDTGNTKLTSASSVATGPSTGTKRSSATTAGKLRQSVSFAPA